MGDFSLVSNRFEILAIMREAFKNTSQVTIKIANQTHSGYIENIANDEFSVSCSSDILDSETEQYAYLSIYNDNGKYEFQSVIVTHSSSGDRPHLLFALPVIIKTYQRRSQIRLSTPVKCHFRVDARKNGYHYAFLVKNISYGGCALILRKPDIDTFLNQYSPGMSLRKVDFNFGDLGHMVCNLRVLGTIEHGNASGLVLHCHFDKLDSATMKHLDLIMTKIVIALKRQSTPVLINNKRHH